MKKWRTLLAIVLVLCTLLQAAPITASAASTMYVQTSKGDVPLRYEMGSEHDIMSRVVSQGTVMTVVSQAIKKTKTGKNTWYLVTVAPGCTNDGENGYFWVYSGNTTSHSHNLVAGACTAKGCGHIKSINTVDGTTRYMEITRNGAPVRELPYNDGRTIKTYNQGDQITTVGKVTNYKGSTWYKVNTGGYIFDGNVKPATEKKKDAYNNSINNSGFPDKKDDFISYTPKECKKHSWSVGKCVNCGAQWDLKIYTVSGTFKAKSDNSVARSIPYKEGTVMRTYKKGDIVPINASAVNSVGHPWYRTTDGYWIYGVEDVTVTGITLNTNIYTFSASNQSFQLKAYPKPANGILQSASWSSSNTAVATVSASGLVKPVGMGDATITCTATSAEGHTFTATTKIRVPEVATLDVWDYNENVYSTELAKKCSGYMSLAYPSYNYTKDRTTGEMIVFNTCEKPIYPNNLTRLLRSEGMAYQIYNYDSMTHYNSPFVIAEKMVNYQGKMTPLIYVIIEGSAGRAGWEGNMLLTGTTYSEGMLNEHATFRAAASDMMCKLQAFIEPKNYANKPLVVITGHSRGAAVGTLLGQLLNELRTRPESYVQKIYGYNFAPPNHVNLSSVKRSENLFSIVNTEDLVTYIPLKTPGWDYGKHGIITTFSSTQSYNAGGEFKRVMDLQMSLSDAEERNKPDYEFCFDTAAEISTYVGGKWKNVAQYYDKSLLLCDDLELVDYFFDGLAKGASEPKDVSLIKKHVAHTCAYSRISRFLAANAWTEYDNLSSFADSHSAYTYHAAMLAGVNRNPNGSRQREETASLYSSAAICENDRFVLTDFFLSSDNNQLKLEEAGWEVNEPATWTGVQCDENGNVTDLDLSYLELDGWLDVTSMTQLQTLRLDGNEITMLAVNGCENLRELHCTSNLLTSLNVSQCPSLETLNCSYNQITALELGSAAPLEEESAGSSLVNLSCHNNKLAALDLSGASALQTLRCGNNQLTGLDISACTALNTFFCNGNQINAAENQELADAVAQINLNGGSAAIGSQQYNSNFAFNTEEVAALNEFAGDALNREKLGWVEDDPWNWKGVTWVLYENEYRVAALELDDLELEGNLNLPNAVCLETLSCSNASMSVLNLSGCVNLSSVNCYNAGISELSVDGCSSLTELSCDENALSQEVVAGLNTALSLNTGLVDYEKQNILVDEDKFDAEERTVLVDFLSYGTNAEALGWDWDWPGTWDGIVWTMDTEADLYRVNKIELPNLPISGTLDLSAFDYLESFDFSGSGIETVILPDCVTEIPDYAFYNSGLREIHLNQGLSNIGTAAFAHCRALETVALPATVSRIGDQAFYGCETLKQAVFTGGAPAAAGSEIFDLTDGAFVIEYFAETEWSETDPLLEQYFAQCREGDTLLVLNGGLELDTDETYSLSNQYAGHDVGLTVVTRNPGTTAVAYVAVYNENGAMVSVEILPLELNRTMNVFRLEDIDLQYAGEEFCQLKIILLQEGAQRTPLAVNVDRVLYKPETE